MTSLSQSPRRERWEAATRIPLIILGFGFIVSYSMVVLWRDMPPMLFLILGLELVLAWLLFLIDYLVRVLTTPKGHRAAFVRANLLDLLSVIIPMFRAFRVLNLLRNFPYFQRKTPDAVRITIITFGAAYAVLFIYFIALTTLVAERDAEGANITDFGQAIWWGVVTVATVGYGDTYPVTALGRFYAVTLMIGGVAIIGTASALIISYITERVGHVVKTGAALDGKAEHEAEAEDEAQGKAEGKAG